MKSWSTSLSENSDDSLRDNYPSPQTPLDASGDFVHSPAAIMNQRKSAFPLETLDCLGYLHTTISFKLLASPHSPEAMSSLANHFRTKSIYFMGMPGLI
jgi:hypothetical protein